MVNQGKVFFIGAGPGAPDLLTIRAKRVIDSADVILYAGSLVSPTLFEDARPDAVILSSASMTLEQISEAMVTATNEGRLVARVHTGDPAIYGAIQEQIAILKERGIPYEIIPGVSSAFAAAAILGIELTVPDISQTVILTRAEGRTPVPPLERLSGLASHRATMVLFLSIGLMDKVVSELITGGYPPQTPVAVVHQATWPDEQVLRGTLADIAAKVETSGIRRQALILVGEALNILRGEHLSRLYDQNFGHGFRASGATGLAEEPKIG